MAHVVPSENLIFQFYDTLCFFCMASIRGSNRCQSSEGARAPTPRLKALHVKCATPRYGTGTRAPFFRAIFRKIKRQNFPTSTTTGGGGALTTISAKGIMFTRGLLYFENLCSLSLSLLLDLQKVVSFSL